MTAKLWTLLTGVGTVTVFLDPEAAEQAAMSFVQSCDDERSVTVENWRAEFNALNQEMDNAGEAAYLCSLTEHDLPHLRALALLQDGEVQRIEVAPPLSSPWKLLSSRRGSSLPSIHPHDILSLDLGDRLARVAVGHTQFARPATVDLRRVFAQLADSVAC